MQKYENLGDVEESERTPRARRLLGERFTEGGGEAKEEEII